MGGLNDFIGVNVDELRNKKLWLFDMDGTIYEENRVFDGTFDILKRTVELGMMERTLMRSAEPILPY